MKGIISKKIDGKEVWFKFGMNFYFAICEHRKLDSLSDFMTELSGLNDVNDNGEHVFNFMRGYPVIKEILYFSALTYCRENNIEPDFNIWNAGAWANEENLGMDGALEILTCMFESQKVGSDIEEKVKKNPNMQEPTKSKEKS